MNGRKILQHEVFGLSDGDCADVLVEIAKISLEEPSLWHVMQKCKLNDKERDFFMYQCGFELGLRAAKLSNCPDVKCCECEFNKTCNIALEVGFFNKVRQLIKEEGENAAKDYVLSVIRRRRLEMADENRYFV